MNRKHALPITLGVLLFASGNLVNLVFSGSLLWGEVEAHLYAQQTGNETLRIECPLMIAPWETASVRTVVTNTLTDETTKPQVNALISHKKDVRVVSETLELAPLESRTLQWDVDQADIVFDRLILVNILQRPYRDLPSRQGVCSILVFSLPGLNGRNTVLLLVAIGIPANLLGAALIYRQLRPFNEFTKSLVQLNGVFLCLVLLGLLAALTRRWGLTLVLDAAALLAITTGNIEILFGKRR